jgi:hypothetical protein
VWGIFLIFEYWKGISAAPSSSKKELMQSEKKRYMEIFGSIFNILPISQLKYLKTSLMSEGISGFINIYGGSLNRIDLALKACPALYETDGKPFNEKIVYFHYFVGGSDWWIVEIDKENNIAFGFTCLNNDMEMAEWGNIYLDELRKVRGVELDFHWTPRKFSVIKK